jgi:hypothetical protein
VDVLTNPYILIVPEIDPVEEDEDEACTPEDNLRGHI